MSSAYENAMADLAAENHTQRYPVTPYWMDSARAALTDEIAARAALEDRADSLRELAEALIHSGKVDIGRGDIGVSRRAYFALADALGITPGEPDKESCMTIESNAEMWAEMATFKNSRLADCEAEAESLATVLQQTRSVLQAIVSKLAEMEAGRPEYMPPHLAEAIRLLPKARAALAARESNADGVAP